MYMSVSSRAAASYRSVGAESVVHGASPHQLIVLLFDGALRSIGRAKEAMRRRDIATKGREITQAVNIIQEGLIAHLDMNRGGEIAANLLRLYEYAMLRLAQANLRNDEQALDEVSQLIETVSKGWAEIRDIVTIQTPAS